MINFKEVRIGNIYRRKHGKGFTDEIMTLELLAKILSGDRNIAFNDFDNITLIEEWLIHRFGFNKDYKKGWIGIDVNRESGLSTDFVLAEPFTMGEWQNYYAFVYDTYRFVKLEYVHQLQNLYSAHTQKELELLSTLSNP